MSPVDAVTVAHSSAEQLDTGNPRPKAPGTSKMPMAAAAAAKKATDEGARREEPVGIVWLISGGRCVESGEEREIAGGR